MLPNRFPFKDGDLGNGIHPNIISSWWCRNMRSLFLLACPHPHCCWVNPPLRLGRSNQEIGGSVVAGTEEIHQSHGQMEAGEMAQPSATWWCFSRWIVGMGQGTVAWEVNVIICVLTSLWWQKFHPQRSLLIIAGGIQRKTGSSTCGWSPTVKFQVAIGRFYIYIYIWCLMCLVSGSKRCSSSRVRWQWVTSLKPLWFFQVRLLTSGGVFWAQAGDAKIPCRSSRNYGPLLLFQGTKPYFSWNKHPQLNPSWWTNSFFGGWYPPRSSELPFASQLRGKRGIHWKSRSGGLIDTFLWAALGKLPHSYVKDPLIMVLIQQKIVLYPYCCLFSHCCLFHSKQSHFWPSTQGLNMHCRIIQNLRRSSCLFCAMMKLHG